MLQLVPLLMTAAALQWQTDTTGAVAANARLYLKNDAGRIEVRAWERNEMRIQAEHGSRDEIRIETRGDVIRVEARRRHGRPIVDYRITVPAGMALQVGGVHAEVHVEGVRGDIQAESVEGDIIVRGGGGSMNLSSVEGDIILDGARGRVQINAVDGDVHVSNVVGDVTIENIDGELILENIDATRVDANTVDGDVRYSGTIRDGGRYRFTSHDGDVTLAVPAGINATISVATFDGEFVSDFPLQLNRAQAGRRFSFTLGSGSATVELESFDGEIILQRR